MAFASTTCSKAPFIVASLVHQLEDVSVHAVGPQCRPDPQAPTESLAVLGLTTGISLDGYTEEKTFVSRSLLGR